MFVCGASEVVKNSPEDKVERNTGIWWLGFIGGAVFGNLYVFLVWQGKSNVNEHDQVELAIIMSIISLLGTFSFLLLKDIDAESDEEEKSPLAIMNSALSVISIREVKLMLPVMAFAGMELGYWQSVYPTCIGATKESSRC